MASVDETRSKGRSGTLESLAVIVVNYRTPELTVRCIEAVAAARDAFPGLRLLVTDGASGDGSIERIDEAIATRGWGDWVRLLPLAINGGFGFANNQAIAAITADGDVPAAIALINPDAAVRPGALEAMATLLDRQPRAAAVGGLLIHEDGRRQSSAFHFPSLTGEFCSGARTAFIDRLLGISQTSIELDAAGEVPWVTGAAVMFRTAALAGVGLFDEGFFLYYEETELMHRLRRANWSIWHEPAARVVHAGGAATQIRDPETGLPRRQRLPAYWYDSRRRYFALTRGRSHVFLSGAAWILGRAVWRLRQLIVPRPETGALGVTRDIVSRALWARRRDIQPARGVLGQPAHTRPAWMAWS